MSTSAIHDESLVCVATISTVLPHAKCSTFCSVCTILVVMLTAICGIPSLGAKEPKDRHRRVGSIVHAQKGRLLGGLGTHAGPEGI